MNYLIEIDGMLIDILSAETERERRMIASAIYETVEKYGEDQFYKGEKFANEDDELNILTQAN